MPQDPSAEGEGELRELLAGRVRAIQAKDVEAVAAQYDEADVVMYNLAPPLQTRGLNRDTIRQWFDSYDGPIGCETADERFFVGDGVAFCHYLYHISGTQTSGSQVNMWVRATLGFRRHDGGWKIVHGHDSDPFDMKTFQALLDLKP
ncbi:MAG TPA: nuclear transport factor 2 family protein [Longimicrobium sp.]|nr:nuclear transport factor 2 family protein [Longimicrobium sp.]